MTALGFRGGLQGKSMGTWGMQELLAAAGLDEGYGASKLEVLRGIVNPEPPTPQSLNPKPQNVRSRPQHHAILRLAAFVCVRVCLCVCVCVFGFPSSRSESGHRHTQKEEMQRKH